MVNQLTQSRLKELIEYNQITGLFTWKINKGRSAKAGELACKTTNAAGYYRIGIDGARHAAHRLAWFYMHGSFPKFDIDHINRIRTDNRIMNLRPVTRSENLQNTLIGPKNSSGYKGVYWHKKASKWIAQIKSNGVYRYLGLFEKLEDAAMAYSNAASVHHTHNPIASTAAAQIYPHFQSS